MSVRDPSPLRRHILSSINLDKESRRSHRKRRSPSLEDDATPADANVPAEQDEESTHRRKRLKLKDPRRHRSSRRDRHEERDRHHRRHRARSPTPPNPYEAPPLDPEAAFRESLFDAMADDEGAAYWEGIYGQPVHVYKKEKVGPQGELEQMTDEEYAAYVRQKMWEKTHEGMLAERERLKEERRRMEKLEKEARRAEREARKVLDEVEKSLRRGEERKSKLTWAQARDDYGKRWSEWEVAAEKTAAKIPWPVKTRTMGDVDEATVRTFFESGLARRDIGDKEFALRMKDERVRWHPDKFQRQLGGELHPDIMSTVTMIFQVVDALWNDTRRKDDVPATT